MQNNQFTSSNKKNDKMLDKQLRALLDEAKKTNKEVDNANKKFKKLANNFISAAGKSLGRLNKIFINLEKVEKES